LARLWYVDFLQQHLGISWLNLEMLNKSQASYWF